MVITKGVSNYSLAFIFLFIFLVFMPISFSSKTINQVKAASWWQTVSEGGLNDIAPVYDQTGTPSDNDDIRIIVARLIRAVLGLLGIIALVIIIAAGFRWMTANGDEEKVTESRRQLTNAVIGLIIILASFAIATFVINQLEFATTGVMPVTW